MLRFTERQTAFVMDTTEPMSTYHDFLASQSGMVLFNSTCMCLQTIGETIRKVNDRTAGRLLAPTPKSRGSKSSACATSSPTNTSP